MKAYRAAVIGLSGIGSGRPTPRQPYPTLGISWPHSHVAAYHAYPGTEVAAVCGMPPPRAAAELWRLALDWRVRQRRVAGGELWSPAG